MFDPSRAITLTYTNWRDETEARTITPTGRMLFTQNGFHKDKQWLVEAFDERSKEVRLFAFSGFSGDPHAAKGAEPPNSEEDVGEYLFDDDAALRVGAKVLEMADRVKVGHACVPGAQAVWSFEVDGTLFEVTLRVGAKPD